MKKTLFIVILILALIFLAIYFYSPRKKQSPTTPTTPKTGQITPTKTQETVDITASFEIYTNGIKRIFTASKYHNLSQDVYITADDPSIVHVKKKGITWSNFFATLPMELSKDCLVTGAKQTFCNQGEKKLRFFLNETENPDALDEIINNGDTLRVTFGL